jgi:hypothetical protein
MENYQKDIIRKNITWNFKKPKKLGGQHCGITTQPIILRSEELDMEIIIGYHKSNYKNKELALTLFELALDELVK